MELTTTEEINKIRNDTETYFGFIVHILNRANLNYKAQIESLDRELGSKTSENLELKGKIEELENTIQTLRMKLNLENMSNVYVLNNNIGKQCKDILQDFEVTIEDSNLFFEALRLEDRTEEENFHLFHQINYFFTSKSSEFLLKEIGITCEGDIEDEALKALSAAPKYFRNKLKKALESYSEHHWRNNVKCLPDDMLGKLVESSVDLFINMNTVKPRLSFFEVNVNDPYDREKHYTDNTTSSKGMYVVQFMELPGIKGEDGNILKKAKVNVVKKPNVNVG